MKDESDADENDVDENGADENQQSLHPSTTFRAAPHKVSA
jgi:hypothetical protein